MQAAHYDSLLMQQLQPQKLYMTPDLLHEVEPGAILEQLLKSSYFELQSRGGGGGGPQVKILFTFKININFIRFIKFYNDIFIFKIFILEFQNNLLEWQWL